MGKPVAGEIVIVPFPQTNLQIGERRPALVVADIAGNDLILCQITSQAHSDGYSIPLRKTDFDHGNLALESFIRPNRLFTVEQSVILYSVGNLKLAKLQEVKAKLRQIFV
jgi:mRNA interferase MazF